MRKRRERGVNREFSRWVPCHTFTLFGSRYHKESQSGRRAYLCVFFLYWHRLNIHIPSLGPFGSRLTTWKRSYCFLPFSFFFTKKRNRTVFLSFLYFHAKSSTPHFCPLCKTFCFLNLLTFFKTKIIQINLYLLPTSVKIIKLSNNITDISWKIQWKILPAI